jgi:predicted permease
LEYPSKVDVWTPAQFEPTEWTWRGEGTRFVNVVGRLKQNVSIVSAQRELSVIGERLRTEYANSDGNWRFGSESLRDFLYGSVKPALLLLMAAAGVLLLIACINVANLLLSRGTARMREVSLRRVLGASPGRILIQFVTENTLLSLLGGGMGLLAAYLLVRCLGTRLPGDLGRSAIALNWPVACFTFSVSLLTGIFFGCVPVLQARNRDLNTSLKQGGARLGRSAGNRIGMAFICVEVALSLVLLVGASLLGESLWNLLKSPLGFQSGQVLTFRMTLPWSMKPKLVNQFYDQLQQAIQTIPGVSAVGQVGALPTVDWHMRSSFDVDWKPRTAHGDAVNVEDRTISGAYLKAMAIPLLAGRMLTEEDANAKPPRALVNQQFAEQYFPGGSVIGRHLINSITQFEIVGVIGNVRGTGGSIAAPVGPEFYFHFDEGDTQRYFVVRSPLAADQLTSAIREKVHQLDATQAISDVATLKGRLNQAVAQPRFNMGLLGAFAAAALMLACVGIYGVVSFTVAQRSIEIGIRMALGATRGQILGLFIRRTALAALIGLATGGMAAFLLARLLQSQLYGVQPGHLPAYLLAAALLMLSTVLATYMPAAKASSLNPALTMRDR